MVSSGVMIDITRYNYDFMGVRMVYKPTNITMATYVWFMVDITN